MTTASSVEEYLAGVPAAERAALEELRATIRAAAPDTIETISYQMPTFKYRRRALVGFAAFTHHCSLFPYSKGVLVTLADELRLLRHLGQGRHRPLHGRGAAAGRAWCGGSSRTRIEEIDAGLAAKGSR